MSALARAQFAYFYSLRRFDGATLRRTLRSPSGRGARFVFGTRFRARVDGFGANDGEYSLTFVVTPLVQAPLTALTLAVSLWRRRARRGVA